MSAIPSYGAQTWIGIGQESAWGSAAARTKFLEVISDALRVEKTIESSRVARGLDPQRTFTAFQIARGAIETELMYEGSLELLYHLLGSKVSSVLTAAQSNRHQIARAASLPTGLTIESERDQQNFLFLGQKIGQAVLRFVVDQYPSVEWSFTGSDGTDNTGSESTPVFPTDSPILPEHGKITIGGTDYSAESMSVEVTIGNALDGERRRIGAVTPKVPVRSSTRPEVRIRIDAEHNSVTDAIVAAFLAGTDQEVTLEYVSTLDIGSSADKFRFKLECPICEIVEAFPTVSDPGILPLPIELWAKYAPASAFDVDSGQDGAVKITVDNAQATI